MPSICSDNIVRPYWARLGWTAGSWQGLVNPPESTNEVLYNELTPEQQTAVQQLCYTPEAWDGLPFGIVPGDDVSVTLAPTTSTPAGSSSAATTLFLKPSLQCWIMASVGSSLLTWLVVDV